MISKEFKEELEKQLTECFSRNVKITDLKSVSGGCINEAFRMETNLKSFFLKINSAKTFPRMFETEVKGLELLTNSNAIKIPSVILYGTYDDISFLVLEWIEKGKRRKDFFEDFGRKLASLHKHTNGHFGLNHNNFIGSLPQSNTQHENGVDFFIHQRLAPQIQILKRNGSMDTATEKLFEHLFKRLPELLPADPPSLLHGDLWNGNYMHDQKGDVCLFDPSVYYSFREIDLAMTQLFGGFNSEFYEAYHETFPLQKDWQQRTGIFNLYPLMVHANLFGGGYLEQVKSILRKL